LKYVFAEVTVTFAVTVMSVDSTTVHIYSNIPS